MSSHWTGPSFTAVILAGTKCRPRFADDDGVAILRQLIDNRAIAIGASPFIKNLFAREEPLETR